MAGRRIAGKQPIPNAEPHLLRVAAGEALQAADNFFGAIWVA